jgi:pimeloyl-ACP methyl ester carboxylesterase
VPTVLSAGTAIHYQAFGDGEPLLLIPGLGCSIEIYRANTPALARCFRVIVFDPRGAGRSASPETGYTMRAYADDAAAVLADAGVASAHVLGTSFGGMVAQNLALVHPRVVRRLVLACTTPGGSAHVPPPAANIATFLAAGELTDPAASTRMRYPLHYSDAYIAAHDDEIVAHSIATSHLGPTPRGRAGQLEAVATHDVYARLPGIVSPALIAHGDEDGVIPFDNARTLAARIPGARLAAFAGAKHLFFVECAQEFNEAVIDFLSEAAINER